MKYVILHYFFIVHLCNINICDTLRRQRVRRGRYDINNFITQLLASRRFDELAEKLAEKAAYKIMNMREEKTYVDRAIDHNDTTSTEHSLRSADPIGSSNRNQTEEKHDKIDVQPNKGFIGKIDPQAVINKSIALTKNLKLKYMSLKKSAMEKKKQRDLHNKNVTQNLLEPNKTLILADIEHMKGDETEDRISKLNATQRIENDVKIETSDTKDGIAEENPIRNGQGDKFHSGADAEQKDVSMENDDPSQEPSLVQEPITQNVETNSETEVKADQQDPNKEENIIKEDNHSSLEEQNQQFVPSVETTKADNSDENTDNVGFGKALAYFRASADSVEENKVPSESDKPNPNEGIDRSMVSNENANRGSQEQGPEDQSSGEKTNEEPVEPVIRREGDKVFTYVQDPEYKDYHEEMAKWKKEHPENPADFL